MSKPETLTFTISQAPPTIEQIEYARSVAKKEMSFFRHTGSLRNITMLPTLVLIVWSLQAGGIIPTEIVILLSFQVVVGILSACAIASRRIDFNAAVAISCAINILNLVLCGGLEFDNPIRYEISMNAISRASMKK